MGGCAIRNEFVKELTEIIKAGEDVYINCIGFSNAMEVVQIQNVLRLAGYKTDNEKVPQQLWYKLKGGISQ